MNNTNTIVNDNSFAHMIDVLEKKGIDRLYHFTDERNIASIEKCECLYSWARCISEGVDIPFPGGSDYSRRLDCQYGLQDYVRLSFCNDHPMMWHLNNRGYKLVLIEFKLDLFKETVFGFTDRNATAHDHKTGFGAASIDLVDLDATQRHYVSHRREPEVFHLHQAEILIEGKLPLDFVINARRVTF